MKKISNHKKCKEAFLSVKKKRRKWILLVESGRGDSIRDDVEREDKASIDCRPQARRRDAVLVTDEYHAGRTWTELKWHDERKGFRNTNSQISASLTSNGRYVISASEDSYVYVWRHEGESRPNRSKGIITLTHSYELFHCQDVSIAIPWPGISNTVGLQETYTGGQNNGIDHFEDVLTAYHPTTPVDEINGREGSPLASGCSNSPLNGTLSSATNSYLFDRISATWPEEKLLSAGKNLNPRVSVDFSSGFHRNRSAWGMVIVTAGLRGEIRTFQNFGLPVQF